MALSPGTRLGPYEILAPIGAGGMGEVYKAKDTRLDRIVAIKVLLPSPTTLNSSNVSSVKPGQFPVRTTLTFAPSTISASRMVSISWSWSTSKAKTSPIG